MNKFQSIIVIILVGFLTVISLKDIFIPEQVKPLLSDNINITGTITTISLNESITKETILKSDTSGKIIFPSEGIIIFQTFYKGTDTTILYERTIMETLLKN